MSRFIDGIKQRNTLRILATIVVVAFFVGVGFDFYERYKYMLFRAPLSMWKPSFFLVVVFFLATLIASLVSIWRTELLSRLNHYRKYLGKARWIVVALVGIITSAFFCYAPWSEIFSGTYARLLVYIVTILMMAWFATTDEERFFEWSAFLSALVLFAASFMFAVNFQYVSNYPFPFYWSEGNRMWDYSVLYGRRLYDFPADLPIPTYIDIGRQSLYGLPFLFADISIWGMRFWSGVVFTVPYALLGWVIFWPQKGRVGQWFLLGLWSFLFLAQGPIWSPLVVAAILVAFSRRMPLLPALLIVGLAGYYARFSRLTWMFAPSIWAVVISLVRIYPESINTAKKRWIRAILLGLAGLSGFVKAELVPAVKSWFVGSVATESVVSVEGIQEIGGRQPLLWERLWPNPTYAPGIVLGLLMAVGPLLILLGVYAVRKRWHLDLWQKLAVIGSLLAFLVVGLIVSVKIGGGSNLHNLDMFLIGLLFVAGLAWESGGDDWLISIYKRSLWVKLIFVIAILLPVWQLMMNIQPVGLPPQEKIDNAMHNIRVSVEKAKQEGDVLFLDHRQLLTFGFIEDVPLVADYEKKRMMDEAMADNAEYFEPFYRDLANQRFSMIISEVLVVKYQGEGYHFGDENDAWVHWVAQPIFCYYDIQESFKEVGAQILIPKDEPLNDPNVECPNPQ